MIDEDIILLNLYRHGEDKALKLLINRHQKKIFALAFYLTSGNLDQAREVTISSFAGALDGIYSRTREHSFSSELVRRAIHLSRSVPAQAASGFTPHVPEEKDASRLVREALLSLSFDSRAKVLLRDQLHLRYEDIASVLGASVQTIRSDVTQARSELQDKI